jgi:hypothetical protein
LCALVPERRRTGRQTAMGSMFFDTPIVTNHLAWYGFSLVWPPGITRSFGSDH